MRIRSSALCLAITAVLAGCASNPRGFSPVMAQAPGDQAAFEAAFATCSQQVAEGRRDSFRAGRTGSAAGGAAIGGVAAVAYAGSAVSGAGALAGVVAGPALVLGAVVFAPVAIFGVSRVQRANKEREIRNAMTACLAEDGYHVADWRLVRGEPVGPTSPTRAAPRA
jgi:hypothetical protein